LGMATDEVVGGKQSGRQTHSILSPPHPTKSPRIPCGDPFPPPQGIPSLHSNRIPISPPVAWRFPSWGVTFLQSPPIKIRGESPGNPWGHLDIFAFMHCRATGSPPIHRGESLFPSVLTKPPPTHNDAKKFRGVAPPHEIPTDSQSVGTPLKHPADHSFASHSCGITSVSGRPHQFPTKEETP
jgi:hypothetical protein